MYDHRWIVNQPRERRRAGRMANSLSPVSKIENRVLETICMVVRNILVDQGVEIRRDQDFRGDLGLDSADVAELLVELEARLGVELPDRLFEPTESLDPLGTVGHLADVVAAHCVKVGVK